MSATSFWSPENECMPRAEIRQLQLERLQATINRVYRNVAFYRQRFDELGIAPEDVQSVEDLRGLPLTEKRDLRAGYPYGMFAVPLREVVRIHMSSGTTGDPSVVGYTRNDVRHWTDLVARNLTAVGVTHDDVVQIFFGYGLFAGGFGFHYGTEAIGASLIPVSQGNNERQVQVMRDFRTTVIVGTPSYALRIIEAMEQVGVDPHELSLRIGLFGDEPWDESVREHIEGRVFIKAFDIYGLAEVGGPGVSFECQERDGLHIAEDQFLVEVIDPVTGEPVGPGEEGELVFTTLNKEAFPLIRYRSGDLSTLDVEPCACGRTHARMRRVTRYTDDRVVVRGLSIFPEQVESALGAFPGLAPNYQLVVDRGSARGSLQVHVELAPGSTPDEMRRLVEMKAGIERKLRDTVGIAVEVKLHEPGTIASGAEGVRTMQSNKGPSR